MIKRDEGHDFEINCLQIYWTSNFERLVALMSASL